MEHKEPKKKGGRFLKKTEKPAWAPVPVNLAYWFGALMYFECLLHAVVFSGFSLKFLYTLGFTAAAACIAALVQSFLPKKANFGVSLGAAVFFTVLYGSQVVYRFIFGTMYSVAQMEQGGAAMTNFWREMLMAMLEKLPVLLLMLVPLAALILLRRFHGEVFAPGCRKGRILTAVGIVAFHLLTLLALRVGGTGMFSDYSYYYSNTIATNQTAERFGLLTTFRLELLGSPAAEEETQSDYYVPTEAPAETEAVEEVPGETQPEATEPSYNVLEFDFDALNGMTEDETIQAINAYCDALSGTKQNEYTGMLADYNLILLCAESFSTGAIHPELTPTLHKLASEGIIFNNYYNSFPNTTTNGEYALVQGLWPDTSRTQAASSLYASRNSYLPFTLGNIFREQANIQAFGYHNYNGEYYGRNESHPNMGYSMKFAGDGMEFTTVWPASDLEMMEQSVDDFIGQEQFHAYYMTFSGHYKYDKSINTMVSRNWDAVYSLDYSAPARAFLSCNLELEKAMSYLMQRLEEEGIADKTAIVLAGDHFPYGLSDAQYSELVGYEIDEFSKFKSTLIFWVGGLEENIVVDEYCCNVDILPTILNLWGFSYDSRMLAGTDVFSDSTHAAVLIDKSFLTDKVWFSADTGEVRYLVDESEIPEGYVENMHRLIDTRFAISSDILNSAYYNFVFEKGDVTVTRGTWNS